MADKKLTQLTVNTTPISTDLAYMVDDPAGSPLSQAVAFSNVGKALDAGVIPNTPAGSIAATNIQAAINELDTEKSPIAGSSSIVTVGTVTTGTWNADTIAIANGGSGQTTQQAAINALTNVAAATNEYVLTKDTATGDAIWKVAAGGGGISWGDSISGNDSDGLSLSISANATVNLDMIDINNSNNSNSAFSVDGIQITNAQNAGTGSNTGINVLNLSTDFTTSGNGTAMGGQQLGAGGTFLFVRGGENVNSNTNGIVHFSLNNTQSGASTMQKIDLGTSAQGHTGLLVNAFNANTSAAGIKVNKSTTGTGSSIEFSGFGHGEGHVVFNDAISGSGATGYGIRFKGNISSSSGIGYGIYQEKIKFSSGSGYGLYQNIISDSGAGSPGYGIYQGSIGSNGFGWYVNSLGGFNSNTGKFFSLNNAQSGVSVNRTTAMSEILNSRTSTLTAGSRDDDYDVFNIVRTSIQNGAGGTFNSAGSVIRFENVATQTAGTLTDTAVVIECIQDNDSSGGHIKFNAYTGTPTDNNVLYYDGTDFKYRDNAGTLKTITAT